MLGLPVVSAATSTLRPPAALRGLLASVVLGLALVAATAWLVVGRATPSAMPVRAPIHAVGSSSSGAAAPLECPSVDPLFLPGTTMPAVAMETAGTPSLATAAPHGVTAVVAPEVASPTPAPKRVRAASTPPADLSIEIGLVQQATRAIAAHDPDAAMRATSEYRTRCPKRILGQEADLLRVQAL